MGFPGGLVGKESVCDAGDLGFDPWVGKIPWRRALATHSSIPGDVVLPAFVGIRHGTGIVACVLHGHIVYE